MMCLNTGLDTTDNLFFGLCPEDKKMNADVRHFVDFYYLEAILADLSCKIAKNPELQFSHAVEKLQNDVSEYFKEFCEIFSEAVASYLWMAAIGEARYAGNFCEEYILTDYNKASRNTVYHCAKKHPITQENIRNLKAIYEQEWHSTSFGGLKWLKIVEAVEMYYNQTLTPAAFLDHAADLQHNGGTAFSKNGEEIGFNTEYAGSFQEFLDYKFSSDILRNCDIDEYVSLKVHKMVVRHNNIIDKNVNTRINFDLEMHSVKPLKVNWGHHPLRIEEKRDIERAERCERLATLRLNCCCIRCIGKSL